jgi:hypothetical protein
MFKPTCINIGGGLGQNEIGMVGFFVSGRFEGIRGTLPRVIGKIHSQQISEIGFINRVRHAAPDALAVLEVASKHNPNTHDRGLSIINVLNGD